MIYDFLKETVKVPVQFRGVPSVMEIKRMSTESRNDKIEIAIKLLGLINGLKYKGIIRDIKLTNKFNLKLYNQSLSNAITYAKKEDVVVGSLIKAFVVLVQDINSTMGKDCKIEEFQKCLDSEPDEFGVRDFDSFFDNRMTETEKKILAKDLDITGRRDVDWKTETFVIVLSNKERYTISSRLDAMKVKNEDIINFLDKQELTGELAYIYENIKDINGRLRRGVYQDLFFATLFKQTYNKYNGLNKAYNFLQEKLAKKA